MFLLRCGVGVICRAGVRVSSVCAFRVGLDGVTLCVTSGLSVAAHSVSLIVAGLLFADSDSEHWLELVGEVVESHLVDGVVSLVWYELDKS